MTTKLLDLEPKRRDAILNAALREFSIQGYDKASTNVIAKKSGISKALMFHYVSSKQELFLIVYDYFSNLMRKEYFDLMNYEEKDLFDRLRQSYLLQLKLFEKYPWIFELNKLMCETNSSEINKELDNRTQKEHLNCYPTLFDDIDESKFRNGLDILQCKQIIYWSNIGFTNQILEEIRKNREYSMESGIYMKKMDDYFEELRKVFYKGAL